MHRHRYRCSVLIMSLHHVDVARRCTILVETELIRLINMVLSYIFLRASTYLFLHFLRRIRGHFHFFDVQSIFLAFEVFVVFFSHFSSLSELMKTRNIQQNIIRGNGIGFLACRGAFFDFDEKERYGNDQTASEKYTSLSDQKARLRYIHPLLKSPFDQTWPKGDCQ